jgi:hypothetical protein
VQITRKIELDNPFFNVLPQLFPPFFSLVLLVPSSLLLENILLLFTLGRASAQSFISPAPALSSKDLGKKRSENTIHPPNKLSSSIWIWRGGMRKK